MTFDEIEREWRQRQRVRRKEWAVAILVGIALVAVLAVAAWYLWPPLAGLFT